MIILFVLFALHIICDFYLQTDSIAKKKAGSIGYMLIHCAVYSLVLAAASCVIARNPKSLLLFIPFFLLHFLIDESKIFLTKKDVNPLLLFLLDQMLHLAVIYAAWSLYITGNGMPAISSTAGKVIVYLTLALALVRPASITVQLSFSLLNESADSRVKVAKTLDNAKTPTADGAGELIGILERLVLAALIVCGLGGAVGFVLAAKTVARFKKLDDQDFCEKYLIGTLLSSFIAICGAYLTVHIVADL